MTGVLFPRRAASADVGPAAAPVPTAPSRPARTAAQRPTPAVPDRPTPIAGDRPAPPGDRHPTPTASHRPTAEDPRPTPTADQRPALSVTPQPTLTAERLSEAAADLFSGTVTVSAAEPVWSLACVYLLRAALEADLDALWARTLPEVAAACRRAQLLVLPRVIEAGLARDLAELWGALSEATHHRSYALPPSSAEVSAWTASVARTNAACARAGDAAARPTR